MNACAAFHLLSYHEEGRRATIGAAMPASRWVPDNELTSGFVKTTSEFPPDYDGAVTATLVRNETLVTNAKGAVLYLHGFLDYFFQRHLADAFNAVHYDFYALDLRKYGRSLGGAVHPNFCKDFAEYFPEMTWALDIITSEGHGSVIVNAHSTGALAAVLYAKDGELRDRVGRIILNSPFLELPQGAAAGWIGELLGRRFPFRPIKDPVTKWYGHSLHERLKGEWCFNTALKPIEGALAFYGWLRAVVLAQRRIKAGLELELPILVMHSDRSVNAKNKGWSDQYHNVDLVLTVEDIKRLAPRLGRRTELRQIDGGKHDLVLSCKTARNHCLQVMLEWIDRP